MTVEILKSIEMLVKRKWNYEDAGGGGALEKQQWSKMSLLMMS